MGATGRSQHLEVEETISSISGALAGAISATLVCPLDVLRTRLQVESFRSGAKYQGLAGGILRIVRDEGIKGLYSGLSPTLFALVPNWAIYFFVYEKLKSSIPTWLGVQSDAGNHMASAAGAGLVTVAATNPLWVVKTRLQTQGMNLTVSWSKYKGTFNALRTIASQEGFAALYSGLLPSTLGVAHVAVQFPVYEYTKLQLASRDGRQIGELSIPELIFASSTSKMIASTLTYPHEVVRSHMHVKGTGPFVGFIETCQFVYRQSGVLGFYRGCTVNLLRTVPAAAVTFTSFELIARSLKKLLLKSPAHDCARAGG